MVGDRVARGVALLDRVRTGWEHEIDLEQLDTVSCDHCILGQLYGRYLLGLGVVAAERDGLVLDFAFEHGFMERTAQEYEALDAAWKKAIVQRRAAAAGGG